MNLSRAHVSTAYHMKYTLKGYAFKCIVSVKSSLYFGLKAAVTLKVIRRYDGPDHHYSWKTNGLRN